MEVEGALIQIQRGPKVQSCSAIKFNQFLLANGSVFANVLRHEQQKSGNPNFFAVCPSSGNFEIMEVFLKGTYRSECIRSTMDTEFHNLHFDSPLISDETDSELFCLFSLENKRINLIEVLAQLLSSVASISRNSIGYAVTIRSTPYSNMCLINSCSEGIISNVCGYEECIFLVDCKLTRGCEGGPVFLKSGLLIGIVMKVFTWCNEEWVGFTVCANIRVILGNWIRLLQNKNLIVQYKQPITFSVGGRRIDDYGVVVVKSSYHWGTGFVVDKMQGIIMTCSHVVKYALGEVFIQHKNFTCTAIVEYCTPENVPFDIAVLRVDPKQIMNLGQFKIVEDDVNEGDAVFVLGYPLFSLQKETIKGPSLSFGTISKHYKNIMMIALCSTNSGSSGSPLIRSDGQLTGMVVHHLTVNDAILPHMSVVIPATVFGNILKLYLSKQDVADLQALTSNSEEVHSIWKLNLPPKYLMNKL